VTVFSPLPTVTGQAATPILSSSPTPRWHAPDGAARVRHPWASRWPVSFTTWIAAHRDL